MQSSDAQQNYERLMERIRTEYPDYIETIEETQKKVERIKKNPLILNKRRYYFKEVSKF